MADVSKIKLPNNTVVNIKDYRIPGVDTSPTSDSTNVVTSEGINSAIIENAGEVIIGTQTAATGNWTGVSKLATASDMKSGYRFTYWLPYAGSGNATLTLTFQDGTTKAINCYYNASSRLTTHISAGNKIDFCYLENANVNGTNYTGAWIDRGYDSNQYDRTLSNYERRYIYSAETPLYRYKICGYNNGKIVPLVITDQTNTTIVDKTPTSVGIDTTKGLVYYGSTTNITAITSAIGNLYNEYPNSAQYTFNENVPINRDVYLKGTIGTDGLFYLDTTTHTSWYVFAPNKAADGEYNSVFIEGCYYMYVGPTSTTTNYLQLKYNNPVYLYSGEKLVPLDEVKNTNIEEEVGFLYRKSPTFPQENYLASSIKGNTLVWNQLVKNKNYSYTATDSRAYYGSIGNIGVNVNLIKDHLYYISGEISRSIHSNNKVAIGFDPVISSSVGLSLNDGDPNKWYSRIIAASQNASASVIYYNNYSGARGLNSGDYITVNNLFLIDLTIMFGSGNEPATVEEFERLFPLPYYDYNSGELISFNATEIETVGFNQWDEQWEVGKLSLSGGNTVNADDAIRSKNFCKCFPSTLYYVRKGSATDSYVLWYDSNKDYLGYSQITSSSFISKERAAYFKLYTTGTPSYGPTYKNDICINISDTAKNGQYEPYKSSTLNLSIPSMTSGGTQIFPDGMRSAGDVYDEAIVDSDGYVRKVVKRIGDVDLGTLTWSAYSSYAYFYAVLADRKQYGQGLCVKYNKIYTTSVNPQNIDDKSYVFNTYAINNGINIKDTAYTDTPTFKTAMSGVMLYYELATPVEYTLDVPIYVGSKFYLGGTQTVLPENTTAPTTTPFRGKFKYFAGFEDVQGMILAETSKYLPLTGGTVTGTLRAASFAKVGGSASQFLKADGSVDSNTYVTVNQLPVIDSVPTNGSTNAVSSGGVYSELLDVAHMGDTVDTATYVDGDTVVDLADYAKKTWVENKGYLTQHQTLKTINNQSLIGSGNINISGGSGSGEENVIESITFNGSAVPVTNKNAAITASIPTESTVSGWGFTKNAGTLTGVKFNNVSATVSNGIASITATIPSAPGTLKTNNTTAQTASASESLSGTINLHKVAKTGTYSDLIGTPTIPTESTVSGWGFTKNTGTYSKPSGGIPKTDLASAVQTSLGKADTALQSYTETDPIFTASAAHGITSTDISNWNAKQKAITVSSSEPTSSQGSNGDIWIVI